MEAGSLACFMISACLFTVLLHHPASPVYQTISNLFARRVLTGIAMGLTLIAIVFSPWGKQSGAHLNPSFTWTFYRLGKINAWDALFYSVAQFAGGIVGVLVSTVFLRNAIAHPAVQYAVTLPGPLGAWIALIAEIVISFLLMLTVLLVSNSPVLTRYTAFFAGSLVALYITFEAPYSGMSMNPARTFGSAFPANIWTSLWVYFLAPSMGMLLAAETYVHVNGIRRVYCAKYNHQNNKRCIFLCNYGELMQIAEGSKSKSIQ